MKKLILASSSKRRVEILQITGIPFETIPSNFSEIIDSKLSPSEIVIELAKGKAKNVAIHHPEAVVIAADSLVFLDHHIFGKPTDENDAKRILKLLSGKTHTVYTGHAVINNGQIFTDVSKTLITMKPLSEFEIDTYIKTKEPMDKAGAYSSRDYGSIFIEKIEGDFYGAIGISLIKLRELLLKCDIDILTELSA